jgi:hypothetical protein
MYHPPNDWEFSFSSLQQISDAQNTAIQTLYDRKCSRTPVFTQSDSPEWNAVWEAVWKKGEHNLHRTAEVLRDEECVDDTLLSDTVPDQCDIMMMPAGLENSWGFRCKKLFMRHEYEEAQKYVLWVCGYKDPFPFDNMVLSGSPGIGTSAAPSLD